MNVAIEEKFNADRCTLRIIGDVNIYSAAELKNQWLSYLESCRTLELDLAEVSEIDAAGFQLLLLLKREAKKDDKTLTLVSHSPAILEVLALLKMEAYFGDPLVLAS